MSEKEKIYALLTRVCDPEIPVLNILDLGVVRNVEVSEKEVEITITPTYSGCPAMDTIEKDIQMVLNDSGYQSVSVIHSIEESWTTDWMSEQGKKKLEAYGIAPPDRKKQSKKEWLSPQNIKCPRCKSTDTKMVSFFGSTACKSLYKCEDCLEPFDYFKCI